MHRMIVSGTMGLALAALGMNVGALAETVAYKAAMNAQSEVPTNDSKGTGTAQLSYDTATKTLTWTITFSDLKSAPTVAHFHGPAEAGKNAGVAVLIGNNPTSPAKGSATLTDAQAADLANGLWYVNVHTADHRGGEIRGQVTK
jgi:CHRD domain-containing protein